MRLIVLAGRAALDTVEPAKDSSGDFAVVNRLHDWFARNPGSPAHLADAAKQSGKAPRQLVRVLKKTTGTGFAEHLNLHRLMLARFLLMRTDRSVVDIARECGFSSREPFIRSFSKALGWTPLQFRKAWMEASFSSEEAPELFQLAGRSDVQWLPTDESEPPSPSAGKPVPITLVVGNALQEIVELSEVTPHGRHLRHDLLDQGRMVLIPATRGGSIWHVQAMESRRSGYFLAPDSPALAVVSSDPLGGK
jgi:AraC-like DNA-binding protein